MPSTLYTYFVPVFLALAFPAGGLPPKNGLSATDLNKNKTANLASLKLELVLLCKYLGLQFNKNTHTSRPKQMEAEVIMIMMTVT